MNKAYRLLWSRVKEAWIVVAEKIAGKGGITATVSAFAALLLATATAQALPTGAQVVSGTAAISTVGTTMTITNSPSAIINWQGFSIAANEATHFIQQSAASSVLNRVVGGNSSQIYGTLQSNGRVFLINQNGILFGPNAVINVNGLVASTLNITNDDFLAGKMKFTAGPLAGKVENQGTITVPGGGSVYLIAPDVENSGVITAPNGSIMLAAGKEVLLVDSDAPEIAVVVSAPEDQALNLGTIVADAGRIGMYGSVVRQKGRISADSAVAEGGKIFLRATKQATLEQGSVTTAIGTKGGTVQVFGQHAGLLDNAVVDVSGTTGGGTVLVGGDYQGRTLSGVEGEIIPNAEITYMGRDAVIKADATDNGNGGKVILWADNTTRAYGSISARGGANGGDGGFVETSGKIALDANNIRVSTAAPFGLKGTWLLDPSDILITALGPDSFTSGGPPWFFDPVISTGSISWSTIETGLASGNVTIQTISGTGGNGDITADDGYNFANAGAGVLTLLADRDIILNRTTMDLEGNPQGLTLLAGRNIGINNNITLTDPAAVITLNAPNQISGSGVVSAASIAFQNSGQTGAVGANGAPIHTANSTSMSFGMSGSGPSAIYISHTGDLTSPSFSYSLANVPVSFEASGDLTFPGIDTGTADLFLKSGGMLTFEEAVDIAGANVTLVSDKMDLYGANNITAAANGTVWLKPKTAGTLIDLGSTTDIAPNTLELSKVDELDKAVGGTLKIGDATAGAITVSAAISSVPSTLSLVTSGTVGQSGSGAITASNLAIQAGGAISLATNTNTISKLAATTVGAINFRNNGALTIDDVSGVVGINSGNGNIALYSNTGDIWITKPVNAGTGTVFLEASAGIYTGSGGSVNVIGSSFAAISGTNIGGPVYSLLTQVSQWEDITAGGDVYLENNGGVTTTGTVTSSSGSVMLKANSPLTIGSGGVTANNNIALTAAASGGSDNLTLNGPLTATNGSVSLTAGSQIFENSTISAAGAITRTANLNAASNPTTSGTPDIPPNLEAQTPDGLVLVAQAPVEEDDKDKDKEEDTGTNEQGQQQGGGKQDDKPKKNYCN